jgi:lipopolysaccharide/colanic/teichoic acid biosynthesis glycosyltransferase
MSTWLSIRLVVDRILGGILAVLTAPIVGALAVLVRRHDGESPLITVPRVGVGGRTFDMWKIRSMRVDTADGHASGLSLTSTNDQRITPIGARMRSLHLDELPQLYNVARGEMCLLGPRPEAPDFVDLHNPVWQQVLTTPPGIAGPTQLIVGDWERSEIDKDTTGDAYQRVVVPVKLAIDRWYIMNASLRLDLLVITSLLRHVLPGGESKRLQEVVGSSVPESSLPILSQP